MGVTCPQPGISTSASTSFAMEEHHLGGSTVFLSHYPPIVEHLLPRVVAITGVSLAQR